MHVMSVHAHFCDRVAKRLKACIDNMETTLKQLNVLKKSGHEDGQAVNRAVENGKPWVAKAKSYCRLADGLKSAANRGTKKPRVAKNVAAA